MGNPTGKGGFRKGADPRRHALTTEDRRRGFATLVRRSRRKDSKGRQCQYVLDRIGAGPGGRLGSKDDDYPY